MMFSCSTTLFLTVSLVNQDFQIILLLTCKPPIGEYHTMSKFTKIHKRPRKQRMSKARDKSGVEMLIDFREMRRQKGLTLRDCAVSAIDKSTLLRIELGAEPSLVNALKFAKFLDIPVEKIWAVRVK
jgi:DNA-binding XRE family transcriptional regulator